MNALLTKVGLVAEILIEFVVAAAALTLLLVLSRALWRLASGNTRAGRSQRRSAGAGTADPQWQSLGTELRVHRPIQQKTDASLSAIALAGRHAHAANADARRIAAEQDAHVPTSSAVLRDHLLTEDLYAA